MFKYLNKEYDFGLVGYVLNIFSKTFFYSLLISYIVYNLIVKKYESH